MPLNQVHILTIILCIVLSFLNGDITVLYGYTDDVMCRAALTPASDLQRMAVAWLDDYFYKTGDPAPNRDEIHLQIMHNRRVFEQYQRDMEKQKSEVMNESGFMALWRVLFPKHIRRPWCDVPGKCWVCYEIDQQRKSCEDATTHKYLKQAHHLHRGGMFMLERHE